MDERLNAGQLLRRQLRLEAMIREHWEPFEKIAEMRDAIMRSLPWTIMTRQAVIECIDNRMRGKAMKGDRIPTD